MIRVLVVDDSAVVRRQLTEALSSFPDIEVVDTAADPYVAREKVIRLRPDVLVLDVEMPRMDGLSFLGRLMQHYPLPVVVLSEGGPRQKENAVRAMQLGACEVLTKPEGLFTGSDSLRQLVQAIRSASRREGMPTPAPAPEILTSSGSAPLPHWHHIIAIGASTGGANAIESVLRALPATTPGILIVQHMPAVFTGQFAQRLNQVSAIEVREAQDNDLVTPGVALIAPGNYHMHLSKNGGNYRVRVKTGPPVHYQRPSVDVLFESVSKQAGERAIGIILTGMGADGAKGLRQMRDAGAYTIAQDEGSCVVYGMPREAVLLGAAVEVLPLSRVAEGIQIALTQRGRSRSA